MSEKIVIFGNGAVAYVAYHTYKYDNNLKIVGFTADKEFCKDDEFLNLPLIPFHEVERIFPPEQYKMIVAVGYFNTNKLRAQKYNEALSKGYNLPTVINPQAHTYPDLKIGINCSIGANVTIHPGVTIGNNVTIRDNSFIGHHVVIEDHSFIGAGTVISGGAIIEKFCVLGSNSTIRDSLRISKSCIIGAGVTILQNTNEKEVFVSSSAKKFPFSSDDF